MSKSIIPFFSETMSSLYDVHYNMWKDIFQIIQEDPDILYATGESTQVPYHQAINIADVSDNSSKDSLN